MEVIFGISRESRHAIIKLWEEVCDYAGLSDYPVDVAHLIKECYLFQIETLINDIVFIGDSSRILGGVRSLMDTGGALLMADSCEVNLTWETLMWLAEEDNILASELLVYMEPGVDPGELVDSSTFIHVISLILPSSERYDQVEQCLTLDIAEQSLYGSFQREDVKFKLNAGLSAIYTDNITDWQL